MLAWLRDRRKLLRRYRFLTIAARLASSSFDRVLYFVAGLLWLEQGLCDITLLCIRHKCPFVVIRLSDIQLLWGMHDKAFATKRFKRNAAQQAVKSNIVTTFRFLEAKYSLQCSTKS